MRICPLNPHCEFTEDPEADPPPHPGRFKPAQIIAAYGTLLILTLLVPILHHFRTDQAIDGFWRPYIELPDGTRHWLFMPYHILFLRSLGQLSWLIPPLVFGLFLLSFRETRLASPKALCIVAICQCAFATFYAVYAVFLLGDELLPPH